MEVSAVLKARAVARFDIDELNRDGHVRVPDMVPELVEKYKFLHYPSKPEDFDLTKGVTFSSGKLESTVIDNLVLFSGLITVETLRSTEDSKICLINMLTWGRDTFGLTYADEMITRWAFISQIAFRTSYPLLSKTSEALDRLGRKLTGAVEDLFGEGLVFETASVSIGHDPLKRSSGVAGFSIQHRAGFQFSDNRYFSEAPLQTTDHIRLLEELEADILG